MFSCAIFKDHGFHRRSDSCCYGTLFYFSDQKGLIRLWDVAKPNTCGADTKNQTSQETDPQAARVFEAHNGRIWSLVLCPGESGFYTGGEDETLCFFKVSLHLLNENGSLRKLFLLQ